MFPSRTGAQERTSQGQSPDLTLGRGTAGSGGHGGRRKAGECVESSKSREESASRKQGEVDGGQFC